MSHDSHHFVPAFLLRQWEKGNDEKLTAFRWARDKMHASRFKAKSVAKQRNLYSTGGKASPISNWAEANFLGPRVDGPAAVAIRVMLFEGIEALEEKHWTDWARFLVAQMIRIPAMIEYLRRRGRELLSDGDEPYTSSWIEKHEPDAFDDLGISTLPQIINSKRLNGALLRATWATRCVRRARRDLLISDVPLVLDGSLEEDFLVGLPISPRKLFLAYSSDRVETRVRRLQDDGVVTLFNRTQVVQADRYVYATDTCQQQLVIRHLRRY